MTGQPVHIALTPDTAQLAAVLRVFARHLQAAADEIEHMATPLHPASEITEDTPAS